MFWDDFHNRNNHFMSELRVKAKTQEQNIREQKWDVKMFKWFMWKYQKVSEHWCIKLKLKMKDLKILLMTWDSWTFYFYLNLCHEQLFLNKVSFLATQLKSILRAPNLFVLTFYLYESLWRRKRKQQSTTRGCLIF